jgi:hypothetical protein
MNPPANRRSQSRSAKRSASTAKSKTEKATTFSPAVPVAEPSNEAETVPQVSPEVLITEPSNEVETVPQVSPEVLVTEPSNEAETVPQVSPEVLITEPSNEVETVPQVSPEVLVTEPSNEVETVPQVSPEVLVTEPSNEVETVPQVSPEVLVTEPSNEVETVPQVSPEVLVTEPSNEVETVPQVSPAVPIPPPSHPRQYRAIGLVLGQFEASEANLNQGVLLTADGAAIDTVLLGRMMSLVKKHLDLAKPHLWVVYPRSRQEEEDKLHFQICGVWEPETLHAQAATETTDIQIESGYFSIRGEVVFYSLEKEIVIVKIRQSPKKEGEKPKFFKLKLKGNLPGRPLRNFWDIQVQLQEESLTIVSGTDLGPASKRKPFKKGDKKPWSKQPRKLSDGTPELPIKSTTSNSSSFERPIKKWEIKKDN